MRDSYLGALPNFFEQCALGCFSYMYKIQIDVVFSRTTHFIWRKPQKRNLLFFIAVVGYFQTKVNFFG